MFGHYFDIEDELVMSSALHVSTFPTSFLFVFGL
jgi:hypothetical protein